MRFTSILFAGAEGWSSSPRGGNLGLVFEG
jgi:hypothetical protein